MLCNKNRHLSSWDYCSSGVVALFWWLAGFYRVLFPDRDPCGISGKSVVWECFYSLCVCGFQWKHWLISVTSMAIKHLVNIYSIFFLGQAPAIEISDQNAAAASAFRKWSWNWISEEFQAFASPFFSELLLKDMSDALGMAWVCQCCQNAIPAQAVQLTHSEILISELGGVGSQELPHRPSLRNQQMKQKNFCESNIFMFLIYFCI